MKQIFYMLVFLLCLPALSFGAPGAGFSTWDALVGAIADDDLFGMTDTSGTGSDDGSSVSVTYAQLKIALGLVYATNISPTFTGTITFPTMDGADGTTYDGTNPVAAIDALLTLTDNAVTITGGTGITFTSGEISVTASTYEDYDTAIVKSDEAETITAVWDFSGATTAAINVVSYSANQTLSAVNARGSFILGTAAMTLTLPTAVAGYSGCFLAGQGVTAIIQLAPATGDYLVVDGVRGTAATAYASDGSAGDKICFVAANADDWYITSEVGTWSE